MSSHRLVTITHGEAEPLKLKVFPEGDSKSSAAELISAIESHFKLEKGSKFRLVDKEDCDIVIDHTVETGTYKLDHIHAKAKGCCPPESHPALEESKEYTQLGKIETIGGLELYHVGDKNAKKGLLVLPEIFGIHAGRLKIIADYFSEQGYYVVLPALMHEHYWPVAKYPPSDWAEVLAEVKKTTWDHIESDLTKVVFPLFAARGIKDIGAIGFCWGTFTVVTCAGKGYIKAGAGMHPSHGPVIGLMGKERKTVISEVKCPLLICAAGNDDADYKPGGLEEKVLKEKSFGDKCIYNPFEEMTHGWVTRGELSDPKIKRDNAAALALAVDFFAKNL